MRKICLGAIAALFAVACTRAAEPPAPPPASAIDPAAALQALGTQERDRTHEQSAVCPRMWTCNYVNWWSTLAQCTANCGSACWREYDCSGNCVCP